MFLPHFEVLTDGLMDESFSFMSEYPNPDQSGGLFGGGYYTTFNGFGSLSAILHALISSILTIMLVNQRLIKAIIKVLFFLMIILNVLSMLDMVMAPAFLDDSVKLKIGFYVLRILELTLFYFAYVELNRLQKTKIESSDFIDDFQKINN